MTEYICARWRDVVTDPPMSAVWRGIAKRQDQHWMLAGSHLLCHGDQWLDITDIPAIPREKVQAAVDEMQSKANAATLNTPQEIAAIGIRGSIGCIAHHTGITPTEVDCGTSVERVLTEIEIDSFAVTP
jgi:hypothetical protein